MLSKKILARIGFVVLISILLSSSIYLQFYDRKQIQSLPDFGEVSDFSLPSIEGDNFIFSSTDGNIRFVWFIYTKCQQGCAELTSKVSDVYDLLQTQNKAAIITLITIDFDYRFDTIENLTNYANLYYEDGDSWEFVLGNESQTNEVAKDWNFYFELESPVYNTTNSNSTQLTVNYEGDHEVVYIHSFILYIVDQDNRLRRQFIDLDWKTQDIIDIVDFLVEEKN